MHAEPKLEIIYFPLYPWLGEFTYTADVFFCSLSVDKAPFCLTAGESVLTGSGPKWQRTRRLLTPSFHFAILKPYVKVFSDCTDVLLVSSAAHDQLSCPMGLECMQCVTVNAVQYAL